MGHDAVRHATVGHEARETTRSMMFTMGSGGGGEDEDDGGSMVKEARRKIEEEIRKERRFSKVKDTRRPLLSTPMQKRAREEDGTWRMSQASPKSERTLATPGRRIQTPIINFLINQTKEERRKCLQKPKMKSPDMSASPSLKSKDDMRKEDSRKGTGAKRRITLKPGKVPMIKKYFEECENVPESSKAVMRKSAMHNNNVLCPPDPGQTEHISAGLDPEMAVQLQNTAKPAQPIIEEGKCHMTELGPMGNCQTITAENESQGSHLESPR